ncbi:MAG TPA: hypothetical protein VL101_03660 [Nordella sp.]|nr:hypothetical protein [Nordella sp.]
MTNRLKSLARRRRAAARSNFIRSKYLFQLERSCVKLSEGTEWARRASPLEGDFIMKAILATTALATTLLFGTLGVSSSVLAQDSQPTMKECVGDKCPGGAMGGGNQANPDQAMPKKRMKTQEQNNQMQGGQQMPQDYQNGNQTNDQVMPRKKRVQSGQQNNDNENVNSRKRVGEGKWRFDPNREHRRRSKNATYRFYFGGYYYPQPYWEAYGESYGMRPGYRVSCGEGRGIVAERFSRVRVVECNGGTYTYMGRRSGDTYRILLNSRTGRIVGRTLI